MSSKDGVLSQSEDASVPLSQLSVGSHSISLRVLDSRGMAAASPSRSVSILPPADQVETLIVENVPQLGRLYPGDKTVANVRPLLLELAMKTKGVVISLDNDPTARAAYTAWNAAGGNTTAGANAVAAAVRGLINQQRALYPGLRYLVLVGDDRVIPHYRMPDPTQSELDYAPSVDPNPGAVSTIGRALYDNQLLTDDYYASGDASGPVFVPTLAIGRLVETPFQILDQLWRFNQGGSQAIGSALASGWDLAPGWSEQLCGTLGNDGLNTDCSLIGSFSNGDFVGKALNTRHDLMLITGHAAHYVHGLPDGTGINATSISNGTADLAGSLIYDGACHTGLNVGPAASQPNDLSQSFISRSGPYIGNTGYAPYSPQAPAYSDELMLIFAREVVAGGATSVGEALLRAKSAYLRDSAYTLDGADVKALAEATLYGLPMFAYTTPAAATAQLASDPVDAQYRLSDLGGGLTMNQAAYQFPPLELVKTPDGSYYTLGGMSAVADGKPVQPKYVADMSFPSTSAHGVVFRGGRYQDITPFDPVVAEALNRGEVRPEPALTATGWVPSLMSRLNHLDRLDAMATLLGQYNPTTGTERLYSQLSLSVYYHQTSSDRQAPAIGAISASDGGGQVRLSVRAGDSSGIVAVVVAYTAGDGVWASAELAEQTGVWNGSFPAGPSTRYFVQVVDGAGNVTALDNDGRYFGVGALAPGGGPTYLPLVRR